MSPSEAAVDYSSSGTARAFQPAGFILFVTWLCLTPLGFFFIPGIAFAIGCMAALIVYIAECVYFSRFRYRVYEDKILLRNGIISTNVLEIPMIRVQSVTVDRTYIERRLGLGSLKLSTAGEFNLEAWIYSIKNFDSLANYIMDRSEKARLATDAPRMMNASPEPGVAKELKAIQRRLEDILGGPDGRLRTPSMELLNQEFRMSPKMVNVWTIETFVGLIVLWFCLLPILFLGLFGLILWLVLLPIILVWARAYAAANFRNYTFHFDPEFVTIRHGIFYKESTKLPYKRIQNLDIHSSYFGRMWGLHSIHIMTAGGSGYIHGIEDPDGVVYFLAERAEDARFDDALGDATELEDYHIKILRQVKKINYRLKERMGLNENPFDERSFQFSGEQIIEPNTVPYYQISFASALSVALLPVFPLAIIYANWYGPRLYQSYMIRFDYDSLFLRKGVWTIDDEMIPYRRIQNAYVYEGVLMRFYNIKGVVIHGPGMYRALPGLKNPEAFVAFILRKAEEARVEESHDMNIDVISQIAAGLKETNELLQEYLGRRRD